MRYGNCMDGFFGHGIDYFGGGSHLFVAAFIILIVALFFIASAHNKKKRSISTSGADETLKMRYVNGEITEEEYQKMKKMIQ